MGALQALAYCPGRGTAVAEHIAAANGCLEHLLGLLKTGPLALRSLAAGALCNLTLGNPGIAVRGPLTCVGFQIQAVRDDKVPKTHLYSAHECLSRPALICMPLYSGVCKFFK